MKPRKILTRKQAMIEASKVYLAESLPENLDKLSLSEVLEFIEDKTTLDGAHRLPSATYELIELLSERLLSLVSKYSYGEDIEGGEND